MPLSPNKEYMPQPQLAAMCGHVTKSGQWDTSRSNFWNWFLKRSERILLLLAHKNKDVMGSLSSHLEP